MRMAQPFKRWTRKLWNRTRYGCTKAKRCILEAARQETLLATYRARPERFVRRPPQPPPLPEEAWMKPPSQKSRHENSSGAPIVTPGHPVVPPISEDFDPATPSCHAEATTSGVVSTLEVAH